LYNHDSPETKIYFENKTCICPQAKAGDLKVIEVITYVVVDNSTVKTEISSDISFWDTSNVTTMYAIFKNSNSFQ
tara:strand:- start:355 stop:579 length:225 start_codon:yes stop_codon:yes gene_type:complete